MTQHKNWQYDLEVARSDGDRPRLIITNTTIYAGGFSSQLCICGTAMADLDEFLPKDMVFTIVVSDTSTLVADRFQANYMHSSGISHVNISNSRLRNFYATANATAHCRNLSATQRPSSCSALRRPLETRRLGSLDHFVNTSTLQVGGLSRGNPPTGPSETAALWKPAKEAWCRRSPCTTPR